MLKGSLKQGLNPPATTPKPPIDNVNQSKRMDINSVIIGLVEQNEVLKKQRDNAYDERNQLVAVLSKVFPAGIAKTAIEGWEPEWHNCVYIDLPTGQASWHYHDREKHLFEHLPPYTKSWDGHTTEEKYERLRRFQPLNWGSMRFVKPMITPGFNERGECIYCEGIWTLGRDSYCSHCKQYK